MKKSLLLVAGLLIPMWAHADTRYDNPTYDYSTENRSAGTNLEVSGLIGVGHYTRDVAPELDTGVGYGAMVGFAPQRNIELEGVYMGAHNGISSNFSTNGSITTNTVGGDLRLNLVPSTHDFPAHLRPYVFGGAAWYNIGTNGFTPGIAGQNAFNLPVGAGIEGAIANNLLIGARYTYNILFNETDGFAGRNAASWLATVNLGATFQ